MLKTMCSTYPENEKFTTSSASLHIYNAQTKGTKHKSTVKFMNKKEMAAPLGQLTALQALNALREKIL